MFRPRWRRSIFFGAPDDTASIKNIPSIWMVQSWTDWFSLVETKQMDGWVPAVYPGRNGACMIGFKEPNATYWTLPRPGFNSMRHPTLTAPASMRAAPASRPVPPPRPAYKRRPHTPRRPPHFHFPPPPSSSSSGTRTKASGDRRPASHPSSFARTHCPRRT